MPVAHCKDGLLERPPLYVREEGGQLLLGSQKCPSSLCGISLADALPVGAGKPYNNHIRWSGRPTLKSQLYGARSRVCGVSAGAGKMAPADP